MSNVPTLATEQEPCRPPRTWPRRRRFAVSACRRDAYGIERPLKATRPSRKSKGKGIIERTYSVDFAERPLRNYVNFLAIMERRKPHVLVDDLTLTRKKSRDGNPDLFRAKIVFLAYEGGES